MEIHMKNEQIMLNELLGFSALDVVKIRFLQSHSEGGNPLELFNTKREEMRGWLLWNYSKKSFKQGNVVIGFVRLGRDMWLLFDVVKITKYLNVHHGVGYEAEPLRDYSKFVGRVIVRFKNKSQNLIRNVESVIDQCSVAQILDGEFNQDVFPGYDQVHISWRQLERVINNDAWKTALENQKVIYLITDKETGKLYVGSASGDKMLYGRWFAYVKTGKGGNKNFKDLDFEYIKKSFSYSILEIFKSTTPDEVILKREYWWQKTLCTKTHGYNLYDTSKSKGREGTS